MIFLNTPALEFLAPLVGLSSAIAHVAGILLLLAVPALFAPTIAALLARAFGSGLSRWPALWPVPSLAILVVLAHAGRAESGVDVAFWIYLAWALPTAYLGGLHLFVRAVRFVARREHRSPGRAATWIYGGGAVATSAALVLRAIVAFDTTSLWTLLLASLMGGLALQFRRGDSEVRAFRSGFARFVWLTTSIAVAFLTPLLIAGIAMSIVAGDPNPSQPGIAKGTFVTIVLGVITPAFWIVRAWAGRRAARLDATPRIDVGLPDAA